MPDTGDQTRLRVDTIKARWHEKTYGGCRQFGLRLKRPGSRWSKRGANAMLGLKGCVMNLRLPDFLDWQARQAVTA